MDHLNKGLKRKELKELLKCFTEYLRHKKYLAKTRLTLHPECPCCFHPEENIFHILSCKERDQMSVEDFINEVKKSFKGVKN